MEANLLPNIMVDGEFMVGGRKITAEAIKASAERLLPIVLKISSELGQPERTGGYVQGRLAGYNQVIVHIPVGVRRPEKMAQYAAISDEKGQRIWMNIPAGDVLATDSANEGLGQWPGGVVSGRKLYLRKLGLITTSSGWKALVDEAYAIAIEVDLGVMTWQRALRLAERGKAHGPNPFVQRFKDEMAQMEKAA